ncbi:xanthine dehydrogenase family protein molybdopterin-binding subunit [Aliigemmobacter aestuarii]|uniref:Xanthine dehydrogenase family protein molybdopterin-binding subunit n=1 Tax=Aliigemmobacter aestuarii TaxID=1445661 RepID=A0A4V3V0J8_9RHOB|nr:molybdopterin cofactor-binding domain-containing protein [Gemmobacter aestuarii]THD84272.1 xanthine dehydrogenase family protein molybdopterin-binding subunit [Gemmobacter aestuarii]
MGRLKTIARRSFLIGTVALAGGVVFGTYAYRRDPDNPLLDDLAEGQAAITPHVLIDTEGVTLITPRADKGQGTVSLQAMLLAEELDVDPYAIRTDFGPPSAAYWNGVVLAEGLPFADAGDGTLARGSRKAGEVLGKILGMQITGGSSSAADAFDRLRQAGAVARETLKAAAAARTGLAQADLKTESGAVVLPDGTRVAYPDLIPDLAGVEPVQVDSLRDPSQWRFLGHPHRRLDIVAKSTGTQAYGIDLTVEGMVFAAVHRLPDPPDETARHDTAPALAMRGVVAAGVIGANAYAIADNTWRAMQAAQAIRTEGMAAMAPRPGAMPDQSEIWDRIAASLDGTRRDSRNRDLGDIDAALSQGEVLTAEYRVPFLAHAALEPLNATVRITADRADIWAGTQVPIVARDKVARLTGLPKASVHVHNQMMGGSFGRRLEDDFILVAVEIARRVTGRAVKVTWTREADFAADFPRPAAMARGRGRVEGGQVVAYDLDIAAQSTMESQVGRMGMPVFGPDKAIVAGAADQPFAIPAYRVTGHRVPAMVPVSSWRSVGASANGVFHDCWLDELIHAAGADPVAERLRLCDDPLSRKVIEAVAEMADWQGAQPGPDGAGLMRGRGVAFCRSFGVPTAAIVDLSDTGAGLRIDRAFVAAEVGRVLDPVNFENQVAGGVVFGLGHAMNCELTYAGGVPEQANFDSYEGMRLRQCPQITVRGLENGDRVRGIGEPPVPVAMAALANAVFAATGRRIRELPLSRHVDFV